MIGSRHLTHLLAVVESLEKVRAPLAQRVEDSRADRGGRASGVGLSLRAPRGGLR